MSLIDPLLDSVDSFLAWITHSLRQTTESYCDLQTADSATTLVNHDGTLVSIIRIDGATGLIGAEEFGRLLEGLMQTQAAAFSRPGHALQVYFNYDHDGIEREIEDIYAPAFNTAKKLKLQLDDLFKERVEFMASYCAKEDLYIATFTSPAILNVDQSKKAMKDKAEAIKQHNLPAFKMTQNIIAAIPDLRDAHDAFTRGLVSDLNSLSISASVLKVHEAVRAIRMSMDLHFTDREWQPALPGDKIPLRIARNYGGNISDVMWPSLARQVIPRDAECYNLRTARVGDRIYSTLFIDLFPKDIKPFVTLFSRTLASQVPWRIAFLIEADGIGSLSMKSMLAGVLAFSSEQNRLIGDAQNLLNYIKVNTDDAVVKLRVSLATWAPEGETALLRTRTAELAKAVEGWGSCEVSELCGDAFAGVVSSALAVTMNSVATPSVAPLSDVLEMLPFTRPASPWREGALLFRSPDGKPWPFQPGSSQQTTWIDIVYARPGSGKSVLSNAINLALCLSGGLKRLPRIAIIDIGPSSSGLISLLKEALPAEQKHFAAYHRLRMTPDYAINPFDTQLGCRVPTPQERSFLVNFLTLLATPIGAATSHEGIAEMAGMVVDELYKEFSDGEKPTAYNIGIEPLVDGALEEIGFAADAQTTWWEVTDVLFVSGFEHEAMLAQRYAMPMIADAASICRSPTIEDLYGKIIVPTGETLPTAFSRMISSAVREYPILSQVTAFDIGEAKVVSLDLDEVAKSGGDAADRQTAVMYMLARYILAKHYYLTEENVKDFPKEYREFHSKRVTEIREDHKRIVFDEFHRTSKSQAVRDQVLVDMREGRKWKVQIALLSQSLEDFDSVMIEFATCVYIMDAGPEATVKKAAEIFGLNRSAEVALRTRVHGPRQGGATFLAQFSTKQGKNTQLLTSTLGPIELWAFSTTADDANIRNKLYRAINPAESRRVLARLFPAGSASRLVEERMNEIKEDPGFIAEEANDSVIDQIVEEILDEYAKNPNFSFLPSTR